jgi:hypothetical protein
LPAAKGDCDGYSRLARQDEPGQKEWEQQQDVYRSGKEHRGAEADAAAAEGVGITMLDTAYNGISSERSILSAISGSNNAAKRYQDTNNKG